MLMKLYMQLQLQDVPRWTSSGYPVGSCKNEEEGDPLSTWAQKNIFFELNVTTQHARQVDLAI